MEKFFRNPTQVLYRCNRGTKTFCGIALGKVVISARSGVVIPLAEIEKVKEIAWIDLSDTIEGDLKGETL